MSDDMNAAERRRLVESLSHREEHPLADYEETFEELEAQGVDPYEHFEDERLVQEQGSSQRTIDAYRRTWDEWTDHMDGTGRHPVCPMTSDVTEYIDHETAPEEEGGKGNRGRTADNKLGRLSTFYAFWQDEGFLPEDYNPFERGRRKRRNRLNANESKPYPRLDEDDLKRVIGGIKHVRTRAIVVMQIKLGLRVGELQNIHLADISLQHSDIQAHYDDLGTQPELKGRPNAIYIPPGEHNSVAAEKGRDGNKSRYPRVLPLDDETQRVLREYLLIRPDADTPHVFTSRHGKPLTRSDVGRYWRDVFRPEYDGSDGTRPITTHFGRHVFSDYWDDMVGRAGLRPKHVDFMRGDEIHASTDQRRSIDAYVSVHYEDIEPIYRQHIFSLGL